jgi:hypothetical protein
MENNNVYILQIEGKDLIKSKEDGYKLSKYKNFKATLDYSLLSIKLKELAKSAFKKKKDKNIFYVGKNGKLHSKAIVSVTFKYSVKNEDDKITANTKEIREDLYENGFDIQNEGHYVRFLRSNGSAKKGKCLFIREELYHVIIPYLYMGLDYRDGIPMDLAGLEAYIALISSSIIDTIQIEPKNILLIDDFTSVFKDTVMATRTKEINGVHRLVTSKDEVKINNCIWDGQSLIDISLMGKYKDKGMLLLRNRFVKSACFNSNIQRFFYDNKITSINQLNGKTIATDIKDIKLITTPSSIKYLKYSTWEEFIEKLEPIFGVVKYEKPTKFYKGDKVSTHYQLINTLHFNEEEMKELLQPTMNYVNLLKKDIRVFKEHVRVKAFDKIEMDDFNSTNDFFYTMMKLNDDFVNTDLFMNIKSDMIDSYIKNIRKGHVLIDGNYSVLCGNPLSMLRATIKDKNHPMSFNGIDDSLIDNEVYCTNFTDGELVGCRSPHVTIGNLALLDNNTDKQLLEEYFNFTKEIIAVNSIKFNLLERLSSSDFDSDALMLTQDDLILRKVKEHYNDFLVPTGLVEPKGITDRHNTVEDKVDLDVKTSVNLIGDIINMSQILNSKLWDMINDGCSVKSKKIQELYQDICQLDVMSCLEIDSSKKEFNIDNKKELDILTDKYKEFILLTTKRTEVKNKKILEEYKYMNALKKDKQDWKYYGEERGLLNYKKKKVRPYFFKFVGEGKDYCFVSKKTSMDYLEKCVDENIKGTRSPKRKNEVDFLRLLQGDIKLKDANRKQVQRILQQIRQLKTNTNRIWSNNSLKVEEKFIETNKLKNNAIEMLQMKIKKLDTMKKLMVELFKEENGDIVRKTITVVFASNKELFLELLKEKKETTEHLKRLDREIKTNDEIVELYGIPYVVYKK